MFDIVAISRESLRLVQVKSNRDAAPTEREAIELFDAVPPGATKEIWIFQDYHRAPIIREVGRRNPV